MCNQYTSAMDFLQPAEYLLVMALVMPKSPTFFFWPGEGRIDPSQKILRTMIWLWQTSSVSSTSEVTFLFYV